MPVAYCVPSRKRPIVVSSGALDQLEDTQLQAVLAHERAHLRYRLDRRLARLETSPAVADNGRMRRLTWVTAMTSVALPAVISAGWLATTPFFC